MMLGILVVNQGFFESYIDIQTLLIAQGSALLIFGSVMFLVAVGMISGAKWSLDIAKRIAAALIAWSVVGTVLAMYTASNLTGTEYLLVLYGVGGWLLAFGLVVGLLGLRYLMVAGSTVRKYAEYVTTEPLSFQYSEEPKRLPIIRRSHLRCVECGSELKSGATVCPECGAAQLARGVA
jgi:hypothetical protein